MYQKISIQSGRSIYDEKHQMLKFIWLSMNWILFLINLLHTYWT